MRLRRVARARRTGDRRGRHRLGALPAAIAIRLYRVDRRHWSSPDTSGEVAVSTLVQTLDIRPNTEAGRVVTGGAIRRDGRLVATQDVQRALPLLSGNRRTPDTRAGASMQHRRGRQRRRGDRLSW